MEQAQLLLTWLKVRYPWLANGLILLGALKFIFSWFNSRLQNWFAAVMARQITEVDTAVILHGILQRRWYKMLAFIFNFLSVKLPTDRMFHEQCAAKGIQLPADESQQGGSNTP